jgi:hypothetical protein
LKSRGVSGVRRRGRIYRYYVIERAVGKRETVNLVSLRRFEVNKRSARRGPQPVDRRKAEDSGHSGGALQDRHAPARCRCGTEAKRAGKGRKEFSSAASSRLETACAGIVLPLAKRV